MLRFDHLRLYRIIAGLAGIGPRCWFHNAICVTLSQEPAQQGECVTMSFQGYPVQTLTFLEGIRQNNNRDWFKAHDRDYRAYFVEPAKDFVVAAGDALRAFVPAIEAQPKVAGSMFRINRDTRFSKDKTPYKDHLDIWFWEGERKGAVSSFFVRVTPEEVILGAGCHGFDPPRLKTFRAAVATPKTGAALVGIVEEIEAAGYRLGGHHYKRPPRGFEATGRAADLLLFNGLSAFAHEPAALATTPDLLPRCVEHWRTMAPLHRWLIDNVQNA